ncbi:phage virion morphogenesis protein [Litoribacter populi]|uniref:phage virion morphogenesis protein n=1 Tax=Litoribacter populi TaxID=2598460 RepID=UPI00117CDB18|nr:phage virion morphogenesis protein [Litoribacter populi]
MSKIDLWFDNFDNRLDEAAGIIAETATEYYKERFIKKEWDGQAWPAYGTPDREPQKGSLMMRTNNLFSSVRPSVVEPNRVVISAGSNKVGYARVHNEGLRVRGVQYVRPHHRKSQKSKPHQVKGHARKIDFTMPKRQFMGINKELTDNIINRLKMAFNQK